jgi:hypothetical protein
MPSCKDWAGKAEKPAFSPAFSIFRDRKSGSG